MKRKELLQKSSTVAAVVLAATLMDPGAVQASAGDQSAVNTAQQVMEQSTETEAAEAESVSVESQEDNGGETVAAESETEAEETQQETETDPAESVEETTGQETETSNTETVDSTEATAEGTTDVSEDNTNAGETAATEASVSNDTVTTGWVQKEDGNYYYVKDGKVLCSCVEKINGDYYAFDYAGHMHANEAFSLYDSEAGRDFAYRAKKDGKLYVNSWYEGDGYKDYYGEDGKGYNGIQTVDGKKYNFYEGRVQTDHRVDQGETIYICGNDGSLTEVKNNAWTKVDDDYYYRKDGTLLTKCIIKIGTSYYGFDDGGKMYNDTDFLMDDDNVYYHARKDGSLVTGWYETDGDRFYYGTDGKRYQNCVVKIGSSYYGFAWDGSMYRDMFFDMWNPDIQSSDVYRASEDGTLVTGWYEYNGSKYYYGADGKRYEGLQTIDGKQYYFQYGRLQYSDIIEDNGKYYIAASDGVLTEVKNNAWTKAEGKYYYMKDGTILQSCVEKIGNSYYGFKWNGVMYDDEDFSISQNDEEYYYRAKAGGALVTGWYEDNWGDTYYYGSDGKGYKGVRTINGKQYFFSDYSILKKNSTVTSDEKYYVAGDDGVLTEAKNNAWNQIDGNYYYLKNGVFLKDCVEKIGSSYYGFDYYGIMYDDDDFRIWDEETGKSYVYRAKAGGVLYVNSWYEQYSDRYYYGEGGKGYDGIYTINGKQYYFSSACLRTDTTVDVDEKHYVAGNDGALKEAKNNAWTKVDDSYYYLQDGKFLKNQVKKIGSFYYGFDWYGKMRENDTFQVEDPEDGKYYFYRAKENGALVIGWYSDGSDNYYYGVDGRGSEGLQTIDGKQYYFSAGRVCKNIAVDVDEKNYVIDNSGNFVAAKDNAWTKVDNDYYYVQDGKFLKNRVAKIGNAYYGFDYDGQMYSDTSFSIWNQEKGENNTYRAKENGSLYTNSWYRDRYNSWYFGTDGKGYEGYQKVSGKQYYFAGGRMCQNERIEAEWNGKHYIAGDDGVVVAAKNNAWTKVDDYYYYLQNNSFLSGCVAKIGNNWYGFSNYGQMYVDQDFDIWDYESGESCYYRARKDGTLLNGWYQNGEEWYYYGADKKGYEGLQTVNGKQYFFSNGRMCCSEAIESEKNFYVADKNGNLKEVKNNNWIQVDGKYYYVKNKEFLRACVEKIGTSYYGFNGSGAMYADRNFSIWNSNSGKSIYYRAKENGVLYTNSWYNESSGYHYYGFDGAAYEGLQTVNGKQYYFEDAVMCTDQAVTVNGKPYLCKTDGTLEVMKNNTWTFYNNNYYYVKNNIVVNENVEKIGRYYYAFDTKGRMYSNQMFSMYLKDNSGDGENKYFFAKADGSLYTNSWVKCYGQWYYAGADGGAYTGLKTIGGKQYFFNEEGRMSVNSVESVQNKNYSSDENGVLTEITGNNVWKHLHGNWYYIRNSAIVKGNVCKIGNDYYGFAADGAMQTDQLFRVWDADGEALRYLAEKDGKVKRNAWAKWNGEWYYFGSNGAGLNGIQIINGKTYYFDEGKRIVKNSITADNKLYICKTDGSLVELKNNAWAEVEGKWYYVQNNAICKDEVVKIGNIYYGFDQQGAMRTNQLFHMSDDREYTCYAKSDGKLAVSTWMSDGINKYYFDKNGCSLLGLQTINGKKYYFGYRGAMAVNEAVEDGDARYIAKADGTLIQAADNAWTQADGNWYYVKNGKLCESEVIQISGKYYGFDENGIMYKDCKFEVYDQNHKYYCYYASESGVVYTNKWLSDGDMMYAGKDGIMLTDCIQTINGVKYLFQWSRLGTNTILSWKDKNYASDGDGKAYELKEKWNQVGSYWYYVKNGEILSDTVETIGSNTYYFDSDGHMATDWQLEYASGKNFNEGYTHYVVDENGYVQKNTTYERWNGTYMFDANGKGVEGFRTVNGRKCYFSDGYMYKDTVIQIGDTFYAAALDGTITTLSSNGWTQVDKNWYYVDNGKLIRNSRFEIKGKTYVFNADGKMVSEQAIWSHNAYEDDTVYGGAKDGTMLKNTWKKLTIRERSGDGYNYYGWAYFDENGHAVQGIQTINGKKYYFRNDTRFMAVNSLVWADDGTMYIADSNGVLKTANLNGWTQTDGKWYYSVNSVGATNCILKINDAYYAFDSNGVMWTNVTFYMDGGIRHANANGKLVTNGSWKDASGDLYYFDANGIGYEGSHKVNGVTYYFEGGRLLKNAAVQDKFGNMFVLDANGKQHTMKNNQWIKVGNYYYYALDGTIVKDDVVKINGKYYGFDSNGRMFDNAIFEIGGLTYHATAGGSLTVGKQYKSGKDTYYFDKTGIGYEGVHYIAGKRCVFSGGKIVG